MAPAAAAGPSHRRRFAALTLAPAAARPDKEMREKFYGTLITNGTHNASGDGSIAEMFGHVLDKEFADSDTPDGTNLDLHRLPLRRHSGVLLFGGDCSTSWTAAMRCPRISYFSFYYCTVLPPVLLGAMNSPTILATTLHVVHFVGDFEI
jgi:hypothetical protein